MDEMKKARLIELFIKHNGYEPSAGEVEKIVRGEHSFDLLSAEAESCVDLSELDHSCSSSNCVSCDFLNAVQILECVSMFFKNSQQDPRQFIAGLVGHPEDLVSLLGTFGEAQMLLGALINAAAALLAGSEEEE